MKKRDTGKLIADVCFIFGILLIFSMGILIGTKFFPDKIKEIVYLKGEEKSVTLNVPGVDQKGDGVMTEMTATMQPGKGQLLVNVNDALAGYELQVFARNAVKAFENVSGINAKDYDISFSMKTAAGIIDGGSASAAMAVALMAINENADISGNAAITGAVDENGKILPVGLVDKKAEAAKRANMSVLIVPAGQASETEQVKTEKCIENYCEIKYVSSTEKATMMPIKEVSTLKEALDAMSRESVELLVNEIENAPKSKAVERVHKTLPEAGVMLSEYSKADVILSGMNIVMKVNCTAVPAVTTSEQADSIIKGIYHKIIGRPTVHDTTVDLFDSFGIDIIAITIDSYEAGYFKGRIFAFNDRKLVSIDAKPSDAVALGSRFDSPLYINNKILEEKGVSAC
ncbi:MAG: bifunctional nuclease domain-containing protein [Nanoarchaeota archaeon]